jgi:hypothetical protein
VWKPEVTPLPAPQKRRFHDLRSQHAGVRVTVAEGEDVWREKVDGYKRMWSRLPETVRHVVVIRDVPRMTSKHAQLRRARDEGPQAAAPACAVPRRFSSSATGRRRGARDALRARPVDRPEQTTSAARGCASGRRRSARAKDTGHLTQVFRRDARALPAARAVRRLMTRWDKPQSPRATTPAASRRAIRPVGRRRHQRARPVIRGLLTAVVLALAGLPSGAQAADGSRSCSTTTSRAPAGTSRALYVAPRLFARQMAALDRAGYTAVTLDRVWRAWRGGRALPRRPVVVSFDDGYANQHRSAAPSCAGSAGRACSSCR